MTGRSAPRRVNPSATSYTASSMYAAWPDCGKTLPIPSRSRSASLVVGARMRGAPPKEMIEIRLSPCMASTKEDSPRRKSDAARTAASLVSTRMAICLPAPAESTRRISRAASSSRISKSAAPRSVTGAPSPSSTETIMRRSTGWAPAAATAAIEAVSASGSVTQAYRKGSIRHPQYRCCFPVPSRPSPCKKPCKNGSCAAVPASATRAGFLDSLPGPCNNPREFSPARRTLSARMIPPWCLVFLRRARGEATGRSRQRVKGSRRRC